MFQRDDLSTAPSAIVLLAGIELALGHEGQDLLHEHY